MIEQLKTTMDLQQRDDLIRKIARVKHDRVAGGLTTYRPIVTFAWHDNVTFVGWPSPGFWRNLQQIGLKQ
jgi:peptide/nickel transport system substrate-binding protein